MNRKKHTRRADIAWLKTSVTDSYYESCAHKFVIAEFDDIYEMISELLTGLDVRAIVLDISSIFDAYNSVIVPLSNSGVMNNNILVYSLRRAFSSARPNGRTASVKFASSQLELCKMLIEIFSNKPSASKGKKEEKGKNPSEQEIFVKEEKRQGDNQEISDKPFVAAELTSDELEALLGPDYLLDISSEEIKEGREKDK